MRVITHPEKVLFPDSGITKGELCSYYEAVAPLMLPHVRGRPTTMERFPAGIEKKGFIQKDVSKGFPSWLERVEVAKRSDKSGETVHYPLCTDARSLVWMANQNSITPHVWISRVPSLYQPDLCVFDLDPSKEDPKALRTAALAVRELLDEFGLPSFVKTSGSKGFHILIPLEGEGDAESSWRFAHGAGAVLVKRHPELLTQEFIRARSRQPHLRRHRAQPAGRDVRRGLRGPAQAGRAGVGPLHLGRAGAGEGRSAHLRAAHDGRAHRGRGRALVRHGQAAPLVARGDRKAARSADRRRLERGAGRVDAPAGVAQGADQGESEANSEAGSAAFALTRTPPCI